MAAGLTTGQPEIWQYLRDRGREQHYHIARIRICIQDAVAVACCLLIQALALELERYTRSPRVAFRSPHSQNESAKGLHGQVMLVLRV